jgi:ATP-binding cassette subfamily B protein
MPKTKQQSSKSIIKFLFELWKISPTMTWVMMITQVLFITITTTIAPIFVSQLLTHIANGTATMNSSFGLLMIYAATLFFGEVIAVRLTIGMAYIVEIRIQSEIASRILRHLTAKSLGYHSNRMSGGIVSDANKLIGAVERFWDTLLFNAIPIATTIISVCVALSFVFWQFAIVLAVLSITMIFVIVKSQNNIAPTSRIVSEKSSAMTAHLADTIGNIAVVKAFAKEETEINRYENLISEWRNANFKEMKKVLLTTGSFGVMLTAMNICAFIAAILATEYHIASIGVIYLVISYTINVVSRLWSVSNTTRSYLRVIGDASPMIDTLCEKTEINDLVNPEKFTMKKGEIGFNDITFTHNENDHELFSHFNLAIKPGEQIGLVGKSGSGKTTLTHLLLRFSDIDKGSITIDGQDITKITQADLHKAIAYVPQESMLFHRSLRDNIAYSKPNATDQEIYEAAKQANVTDFIKDLPKGFDTLVGERGVKLSGGQRQRIAIARAILKDAPILILDEATSALDSENEKLIQTALTRLMKGRTSIVIAHRLSTIAKLDRIIVLDNGNIVEQGAHDELIASKNSVYAKLWKHQSGNFIDEEE